MAFTNLAQATAEDCSTVTNLTTENSTLTKQVELYAIRLSTEVLDNMALQSSMSKLKG